jgi:hypothetical protein
MAGTLTAERVHRAGELLDRLGRSRPVVAAERNWPPVSRSDWPPTILLEELAEGRRRGFSFDEAWLVAIPRALAVCETHLDQNWPTALAATRYAWRRAYRRQETGVFGLTADGLD